jgi:signal transduction histidine kinase
VADLADLLRAKRPEIVDRWVQRIAGEHRADELPPAELRDHLPIFLTELIDALSRRTEPEQAEGTAAASRHGEQRLRAGFDVDEVVREYDLLGDTILEAADTASVVVSIDHMRILLRLINAGTAEAVVAYVRRRDEEAEREAATHVSFVAHELRNPLSTATLAMTGLRRTSLSPGGRLVEMVERSLTRIQELVDQVLTAARFPNVELKMEPLGIRNVIEEAVRGVEPNAEHKRIRVTVNATEDLVVQGDRRLLHSMAANLIGNAIKFTVPGGDVVIEGRRDDDGHVVVECADACGGLPRGSPAELFQPYVQRGADRSGLGLGLAIVKQAVVAHGGTVEVRNVPGVGCIFAVRIPSAPTTP